MKLIALTPGDPAGIGPEITWKALKKRGVARDGIALLCIGARKPFEKLGAPITETTFEAVLGGARPPRRGIWLLPAPERAPSSARLLEGFQSGWAIQTAAHLIRQRGASALVTGPISKERLQAGGFPYVGHTDFLADLCGVPEDVTMMLANTTLRISLVTTHVALTDVSAGVTRETIRRAVLQTEAALRQWWKLRKPRIAVAALNPHAGESGILGREEIDTIVPALDSLRRTARGRFVLEGPLPADTLFANHVLAPRKKRFDAVVCMYHDQGLIPVKLLDFPRTVNVTLGLPIVRTSVDHGTGFDIAGKGIADPSSLKAAIDLAVQIVRTRGTPRGTK